MSLRMQVEKKKAHEEMRRLMAERKKQDSKPMLVDNPLAKYNKTGQLTCVLCSSIVKSEKVWQVHINSKQHRENVEQAKKLKELTNNFTLGKIKQKRVGAMTTEGPAEKKIKGILKNSNSSSLEPPTNNNLPNVISHHNEEVIRTPYNPTLKSEDSLNQPHSTKELLDSSAPTDQPIPEGFFDDPILDAKVRNIEYKDPVEEEWEKFQKEIKEEASASAEIIAGEQEEATAERQIDEIDEQLRNWSRVLDLELKKEDTKKKIQDLEQMSDNEDDDTDHDVNIDEFLDWRAKKSYA